MRKHNFILTNGDITVNCNGSDLDDILQNSTVTMPLKYCIDSVGGEDAIKQGFKAYLTDLYENSLKKVGSK